MGFFKLVKWFLVSASVVLLVACGGGSESSSVGNNEITDVVSKIQKNQENTISGYVIDDPVAGAEVYIDFGNENISTKTITNADGSYELKLSVDDLAQINPEIPDGADGPRDNLLLVAIKDGRILRNALTRDVTEGQIVYITNDTEAYAQYLESVGQFNSIALTEFNAELEKGRIKDSSDKADFIKDIRKDVKSYFYGGERATADSIFEKALIHLGKEKVALFTDDSSYVSSRNIMSGGDILLPENVDVSSDDITLTAKGNGRYTVGDGNDNTSTAYLQIQSGDVFKLIVLDIKERVITQLARKTITPQQGGTLGTQNDSISVTIPPFALNEAKEITFNKIDSEGETADGKMILDMQPSGLIFEMPITVKVKYSDFGIDDPNAVEWKYGSLESGYGDADIVSIDITNKLIYLSISHFSNLVVKSISGQKFVELGNNFVKMIPRRNILFSPDLDNYGQNESIIITNKLFTGSSLSNESINGTMGGQCVQTARSFLWAFNYNQSGQDFGGDAEDHIRLQDLDDNLRETFDSIETGDLIYQNKNNKWGHTFTVFENTDFTNNDNRFRIIESNKYRMSFNGESYNQDTIYFSCEEKTCSSTSGTQRIYLNHFLDNTNFCATSTCANTTNEYIVLKNPDDMTHDFSKNDTNIAIALKSSYRTIDGNDIHPSIYYLLDKEKDGIKKDGSIVKYDPDLLPVTPLKVEFTNNIGAIFSTEDSRYEIYAVDGISTFTKKNFENDSSELDYEKLDDESKKITLTFDGKILHRLIDSDENTEFKMIKGATDSNWATLETNVLKPILFSPNVIDDYYVSWGTNVKNSYTIPIGFWNSYGYNLDSPGTIGPDNGGRIYEDSDALNGYYMTLGSKKSSQWHFALGGYHAVLVHLPNGLGDNEDAEYKLYNTVNDLALDPNGVRTLKISPFRLDRFNSSFDDWYLLYEPMDKQIYPEGLPIVKRDKYIFDFSGDEYLELTGIDGKIYKVDAIRLQSKKSILDDATVKYEVVFSDVPFIHASYFRSNLYYKESLSNSLNRSLNRNTSTEVEFEKVATQSTEEGQFQFSNLAKGKYKVVVSSSLIEYKPQTIEFEVEEYGQTITLPKVTLQKDLRKDSVQIKAINAVTGSAISDADVTVRFGLDRDDNSIAYSGLTDSDGYFEVVDMPYGQYSYILSKDGLIATSLNLTVDDETESITDLSMSPSLADGEMRIRLSWGENPEDLDSHLVKKTDGNEDYHIYYMNKVGPNGDSLDRDDTDGYGPETVTISDVNVSSIYTYYIHHFNGSSSIKDSGSSVKISSGNTELTLYPPNEDGIYWKVFEIENGVIVPCVIDCIQGSESNIAKSIDTHLFQDLPSKK